MKHLWRGLLNLPTIVSLLLTAGFCVLWIAGLGHAVWAWGRFPLSRTEVHFLGYDGQARFIVIRDSPYGIGSGVVRLPMVNQLPLPRNKPLRMCVVPGGGSILSNGVTTITAQPFDDGRAHGPQMPGVALMAPCWLYIALAALPAELKGLQLIARARRRRVRDRQGLCLVCGYDLRATPDRCPECGAIPAKTGS